MDKQWLAGDGKLRADIRRTHPNEYINKSKTKKDYSLHPILGLHRSLYLCPLILLLQFSEGGALLVRLLFQILQHRLVSLTERRMNERDCYTGYSAMDVLNRYLYQLHSESRPEIY